MMDRETGCKPRIAVIAHEGSAANLARAALALQTDVDVDVTVGGLAAGYDHVIIDEAVPEYRCRHARRPDNGHPRGPRKGQ